MRNSTRRAPRAAWTVVVALTLALGVTLGAGAAAGANSIKLGYVAWESQLAAHGLFTAVLEDYLGYEVEHVVVDAGPMWVGMAQGEFDIILGSLPDTHQHYYEQLWPRVENLGALMHGARNGLVVPAYVEVDSIAELNLERARFGGRIVGIDPGAGIMTQAERALDVYDLDFVLVDGSDAAMTAALRAAMRRNQWIVVTGWTPHWKFSEMDLKFLDDPHGVMGGSQRVTKIVRRGLHEDAPDVYAFMQRVYWGMEDVSQVLEGMLHGAEPAEAARAWIAENEDTVRSWLR